MKTGRENHFINRLYQAGKGLNEDSDKAARFWKHLVPLQGALEMYCRHSVNDGSVVEDVLQDAIAKAFQDFHLFAEGTNFRAWVYRYLNLHILSANRTTRANRHIGLSEAPAVEDDWMLSFDEVQLAALLDSPDDVLEGCDEVLATAVRCLNKLERSTLLLKTVAGFKYREIADILELPMGTIMSALSRARQRLRHELVEFGRDNGLLKPSQTRTKK
jgi:RNA polymerase sigma-70 factor (ECF subfamily)